MRTLLNPFCRFIPQLQPASLCATLLTCLWHSLAAGSETPITYPSARQVEQVDDYHGVKIADPYRWLEDDNSAETQAWVEAENKVTFAFLEAIPERAAIKDRLTKLWNYERFNTPFQRGGRYFFTRNSGLQNQPVLYVAEKLDAAPRVLLDPNTLSADGTVALAGSAVSDDGTLLAYGLSRAGSDWEEWHVRDVTTGEDRADLVEWVKFSGASWTKDGSGFFYSRYDAPKAGDEKKGLNEFQKLYFHRLGTKQGEDALIYERRDHANWGFGGGVTDDGRYLAIHVSQGTDAKNRFFYKDLADPQALGSPVSQPPLVPSASSPVSQPPLGSPTDLLPLVPYAAASVPSVSSVVELLNDFDASYDFIDNDGAIFFFKTDLDAPRGRVIAIDLAKPERQRWREIIPQSDDALTSVNIVGGQFICDYLHDAHSVVKLFAWDGHDAEFDRELALPSLGSAETRAGHGANKPISKVIAEKADELSFLVRVLGLGGGDSSRTPPPSN